MTATPSVGPPPLEVEFEVETICGTGPFEAKWIFESGVTATQTEANISARASYNDLAYFIYNFTYKDPWAYTPSFSITDNAGAGADSSTSVTTWLSPQLFYSFYNESGVLSAGYDGSTHAIGLVEECFQDLNDSVYQNELNGFDARFGIRNETLHFFTGGGSSCTGNGSIWDEQETALDIEWAHVAAPGAPIYVCLDTLDTTAGLEGCDQSFYQNLDRWNTSIVSNSWGSCAYNGGFVTSKPCTNGIFSYLTTWYDAYLAGMNLFASTGDIEPDVCEMGAYPASNPYAIAVGGTTISSMTSGGGYGSEKQWHDEYVDDGQCTTSSGAKINGEEGELYGTSPYYNATTYQAAFLGNTGRFFPDVSMDANASTGVPIDLNGTWQAVGGTSVGSPIWAGILDVLFSAGAPGLSGWAIPWLYEHPDCFHAIKILETGGRDGLGTPNVGCLSTA